MLKIKLLTKQLNLYIIIGLVCVTLDVIVFYFLNLANLSYIFANFISYSSGTILSFFLNRKFNFKITDKVLKRFLVFFSISLIGLFFSNMLLFIFIEILKINEFHAKSLTLPIIVIIQFTLNKFITFKKIFF